MERSSAVCRCASPYAFRRTFTAVRPADHNRSKYPANFNQDEPSPVPARIHGRVGAHGRPAPTCTAPAVRCRPSRPPSGPAPCGRQPAGRTAGGPHRPDVLREGFAARTGCGCAVVGRCAPLRIPSGLITRATRGADGRGLDPACCVGVGRPRHRRDRTLSRALRGRSASRSS